MRTRFSRLRCILHFIGSLLQMLSLILLFPVIAVVFYWGRYGDGAVTLTAFVLPAALSFLAGLLLRKLFKRSSLDLAGSMIFCTLAWLSVSAVGALPFLITLRCGYLNAFFEATSGFTTTGITMFSGLDGLQRSILIWRAFTQWLGGVGILSFFLLVVFGGGGVHHIYGAEGHKIASGRLAPGLFNTLRMLWGIYLGFTVIAGLAFVLEGMSPFDALCHSLTSVSTGGFSPHDSSIAFYRISGHRNYRLIEYTLICIMTLGGINFLVHYRVITGNFRSLWGHIEIRYWWKLIFIFTMVVVLERLYRTGILAGLFAKDMVFDFGEFEKAFRASLFQVVAVLSTSGFATHDIGSDFFGAASRQLFLLMMIIGGCAGSTSGGFKVLRVALLNRLLWTQLFKLTVSPRASSSLVIYKRPVSDEQIHRITSLLFAWILLLVTGGVVTALLSKHGPLQSVSGMFSALGNIGPCYIQAGDMIVLHPVVKITYIIGMVAGRLEIFPVLLLFSPRAWK